MDAGEGNLQANRSETIMCSVTQISSQVMSFLVTPERHGDAAFIEETTSNDSGSTGVPLVSLAVPPGVSYLITHGTPRITTREPSGSQQYFAMQPVTREQQTLELVLVCSAKHRCPPVVNGTPAPSVSILRDKDEIIFEDDELMAFVSTYTRPHIGAPPQHLINQQCPACRGDFTRETQVYICCCGTALHHEPPSRDREPLECVEICEGCPTWSRPIVLHEQFSYVPEGFCVNEPA